MVGSDGSNMWGDQSQQADLVAPSEAAAEIVPEAADVSAEHQKIIDEARSRIEVATNGMPMSQELLQMLDMLTPHELEQVAQALSAGGSQALSEASRTGEYQATGIPALDAIGEQLVTEHKETQAFNVLAEQEQSQGQKTEQEEGKGLGFLGGMFAALAAALPENVLNSIPGIGSMMSALGITQTESDIAFNQQSPELQAQQLSNLPTPNTPNLVAGLGQGQGMS